MSSSPIANRSFLHKNRKTSITSDKIVYATLDSLALKRARLPLQLLPIDDVANDQSVERKSEKEILQLDGNSSLKYARVKATSEYERTKQLGIIADYKCNEDNESESENAGAITVPCSARDVLAITGNVNDSATNIHVDELESSKNAGKARNYEPTTLIISDQENAEISVDEPYAWNDYEKVDPSIFVSSTCSNIEEEAKYSVLRKEEEVRSSDNTYYLVNANSFGNSKDGGSEEQPKNKYSWSERKLFEKPTRSRRHFAKSLFHYVPNYLIKHPKKAPKKKKKPRNVPEEDTKYVTISSPSNFIHVASATIPSIVREGQTLLPLLLRSDELREIGKGITIEDIAKQLHVRRVSNPRSPCATPELAKNDNVSYVETKIETTSAIEPQPVKVLEESQQVKSNEELLKGPSLPQAPPRVNSSFLWSNQVKSVLNDGKGVTLHLSLNDEVQEIDDEDYDDIGPPNESEEDYDDVGPPIMHSQEHPSAIENSEDSDEIYDDVGAPTCSQLSSARSSIGGPTDYLNPRLSDSTIEEYKCSSLSLKSNDKTLMDDESDNHYLSINNDYSSLEIRNTDGEQDEMDVYDDVGFPCEERVNSLYAGFTTCAVSGSAATNGKESEWEDLEDPASTSYCPCRRNSAWRNAEAQNPCNKKKSNQRWNRKTRKHRSRASRRSSKITAQNIQERTNSDSTSDDSTYESLSSFQPDDFSTDSETETVQTESAEKVNNRIICSDLEAPTKPTPPVPREASLTQTLGRRIKMLRRTWSITKGSLGRMRRRTSTEDEQSIDDNKFASSVTQIVDTGKYFSFRKHFRKNLASLSTFYLDDNNAICASIKNNNNCSRKVETIYGNNAVCKSTVNSPRTSNDLPPFDNVSDVDPYSVFDEQEPLYQFYAAAAARTAIESDSDGYEEVNISPLLVAKDFVKPGVRTLWCQTPQVIRSGLLQTLAAEEKKVQEAKFEILTSEASYLNSLRVLENEFLQNHELINDVLTPTEKEKLFGGIPSVLQASFKFLSQLEAIWKDDPMLYDLPNVLLKHAEKCLDVYVAYCSNQVSIDNTLKELRAHKGVKFVETIARIEMQPACQSLSLHSFLMLPMQRVTRLPLLADAVLSKLSMEHKDRSAWENVLTSLSYVVAECNEGARLAAQKGEMEMLARKLEYSMKIKAIALRDKQLVRSGAVVQLLIKTDTEYKLTFGKRFSKMPIFLFLLTDYLLVTKIKQNTHGETYTVIDTCKRNLVALESVSEDSPFAGRNAMMLTLLENCTGRQMEYVLTCDSSTERERWLEAVSPCKRGLFGETLYETWDCPQVMALYSYLPNQPDELSLQPGDVINVIRKMGDGWYQGEKLLDGEQGWFPGNYTKEVSSEHVRARNLKQRHRLLALSGTVLQHRIKQNLAIH